MHFLFTAKDKADVLQTRLDNRAAHLDYIKETGCVVFGGPLLNDDGDMFGSMLVIDVADKAAAEAFVAGDPYGKAGLFAETTLTAWKWVIGAPS